MKKLGGVLFVLFFGVVVANTQDCTGFHEYHCDYADYTFFYSRQSKSTLMSRGQTTQLNIVVYGGEDYYIGVCAHRKFGDLQFRILEENDEQTEIFNNAKNDFVQSVTFANERTRNLLVEVTVPEGKPNERDRRCVGVIIQFKEHEKSE